MGVWRVKANWALAEMMGVREEAAVEKDVDLRPGEVAMAAVEVVDWAGGAQGALVAAVREVVALEAVAMAVVAEAQAAREARKGVEEARQACPLASEVEQMEVEERVGAGPSVRALVARVVAETVVAAWVAAVREAVAMGLETPQGRVVRRGAVGVCEAGEWAASEDRRASLGPVTLALVVIEMEALVEVVTVEVEVVVEVREVEAME